MNTRLKAGEKLRVDAIGYLATHTVEPSSASDVAASLGREPSNVKVALDALAADGRAVASKRWREKIATFDGRRPKGTAIWYKTTVYSLPPAADETGAA